MCQDMCESKYQTEYSIGKDNKEDYTMGAWGAKLYQDDVAEDVRREFKDLLHRGKTAEEITREFMNTYAYAIQDSDDAPIFWFALADTQWNLGRLLPDVKAQALAWLDNGTDLARWELENPKLAVTRKIVLTELREKLLSPQPEEKKISQYRLYTCEWKTGDVFAYPLESDLAKEKGLFGQYFLIQKVDEGIWHPGHIVPIVYVKITRDGKLPTCVEEFEQLEYIQVGFTQYEDRFFPIDGRRPQEDIAEKSRLKYEVDEFGFLPEFRITLLNTSKKVIPTGLVFFGNFQNTAAPKKEFVPHDRINVRVVFWKNFDDTFESILIQHYCNHNLRELSIYQEE